MKKLFLAVWLVLLSLNFSIAQSEITAREVKDWIYYLASDQQKGRFPCTPESKQVAERLRQEYIDHGLTLLANSGFQYFEINAGIKFFGDNYFRVGHRSYAMDKDYKVYPFSDTGYFQTKEVVFVGYGFDVNEGDSVRWNDYTGIDVTGKWVVILRGEPQNPPFSHDVLKNYTSDRKKVATAKDHGAAGVIFVNPTRYADNLIYYAIPRVLAREDLPVIQVKRAVAKKILGQSLDKIEQELHEKGNLTFTVKRDLSLAVHYQVVKCKTQNVVALLKSNDPRLGGRYIIIGAHYDHLGLGGYESGSRMPDTVAVHNGADDNASGTTGVMELMEYLASVRDKLGRSIIFVDFAAEEEGLLGSKYFAHHLPVPKDSIDLMINMDMIGKYKNEANFMGLSSARELKEVFNQVKYDTTDLKVKTFDRVFGGSDHASFIEVGIPAIFVYASTAKGYHTPMDDPQFINYKGEARVLRFIADLAIKASHYPSRFHFVKQKEEAQKGRYGGMKVHLGIRPAFGYSGRGVKVDAVVADGVADKAGILAGDVIIKIGDKKVNNIYDYMSALSRVNPGDRVQITVLRDKKEVVVEVQF